MSERKVLNKYFPADYDPSKIPRAPKGAKSKNRQFNLRTMAPFNMRCLTCKCYIYKGRKFNSRMELAEGETYLGLRQYRFHIKCPTCCSEVVWRSDLENSCYQLESGAERNFEALLTAEKLEAKKEAELAQELEDNPMKMLEARTKASRNEMDLLETLQEMKELNKRQANVGLNDRVIAACQDVVERERKKEEEMDEQFIRDALAQKRFKRLQGDTSSDESESEQPDSAFANTPSSDVSSSGLIASSSASISSSSKPSLTETKKTLPNALVDHLPDRHTLSSKSSLKASLKGVVVKRSMPPQESSGQKQVKLTDHDESTNQWSANQISESDTTPTNQSNRTANLLGLAYSDSDTDSS